MNRRHFLLGLDKRRVTFLLAGALRQPLFLAIIFRCRLSIRLSIGVFLSAEYSSLQTAKLSFDAWRNIVYDQTAGGRNTCTPAYCAGTTSSMFSPYNLFPRCEDMSPTSAYEI